MNQYISDQKDILNSIFESYSKTLDNQSEDTERLFTEAIGQTKLNTEAIKSTVDQAATTVDYDYDTGIGNLLTGTNTSITEGVKQIDLNNAGIKTNLTNLVNNTTTANDYLGKITQSIVGTDGSVYTPLMPDAHKPSSDMFAVALGDDGVIYSGIPKAMAETSNKPITDAISLMAKQEKTAQDNINIESVEMTVNVGTKATDAKTLVAELQRDKKFKAIMIDTVSESLRDGYALTRYRH